MTTKTFHDIYDLVELVGMLENATIEIAMDSGDMHFSVTNFTGDAVVVPIKGDPLKIDGSAFIPGYLENVDKAYRMIEDKIASGEWEKKHDCA